MEPLELRMYGFVPYNISEIQKGIQFGHAVVEYADEHFNDFDYVLWSKEYKTFIILNGGTTNTFANSGKINQIAKTLKDNDVELACFFEPDLGNQLTSVVFLVDERVFNHEKYPDFINFVKNKVSNQELLILKNEYITQQIPPKFSEFYEEWTKTIGGKKNVFLKEYLKQFHKA